MSKKAVSLDSLFKSLDNKKSPPISYNPETPDDNSIAVIGMACITADAQDPCEFWNNLTNCKDSIKELPASRKKRLTALVHEGVFNPEIFTANRDGKAHRMPPVDPRAYIDGIDLFDASFFNITAKEARLMDPAQRKWLETAYSALEDAGYGGKVLYGSNTGVFVGFSKDMSIEYLRLIEFFEPASVSLSTVGNLSSSIPGRFSFFMDFKGPSLVVDTACSSSLTAVHMACQSILAGECDQAVAGGIRIRVIPFTQRHPIGIESPNFRSRPFDCDADGTGEGEGVGALVLKPMFKAVKDRDYIYGIIKGSAITQDGRGSGIGTPNGASQKEAILKAWKKAGIQPDTISFFEAHGTATKVGDPIEAEAITSAFRSFTNQKQFCALGAVKSNIGHLYEAAGIFGLIKALKALEKKTIPPNINFTFPNINISFEESPLYIPTRTMDWQQPGTTPRRAGVNCFGLSGVNVHVVLEEYLCQPGSASENYFIFTLSGKEEKDLKKLINLFLSIPAESGSTGDICYTVNRGRGHYNYRIAFIVKNMEDLKKSLEAQSLKNILPAPILNNEEKEKLEEKSSRLINQIIYDGNAQGILEEIVQLYLLGIEINWDKFYKNKNHRRIPLPVYPYNRNSYWIETPVCIDLSGNTLYNLKWEPCQISPGTGGKENWLVIYAPSRFSKDILNEIEKQSLPVVKAELTDRFQKISENHYCFSSNINDIEALFESISANPPGRIINLLPLEMKSVEALYLFMDIVRFLLKKMAGKRIEIINITCSAYPVLTKNIDPWARVIPAAAKTLSLEEPNIVTSSIDILAGDTEGLIELLSASPVQPLLVLREKTVFSPIFDFEDMDEHKGQEITFHSTGCYLITGGTGGLGLETALFLAKRKKVNIVLVSRNTTALSFRLEQVKREITVSGSSLFIEKGDVCDRISLEILLDNLKKRFGRINGIIHSAGVINDSPLLTKSRDDIMKVLNPKIKGTLNLHELTEKDPPDFLVLYSSLSAVFNNIYQGDYSSANAFLDGFSGWRNSKGLKTVSINWPAWKEIGMAAKAGHTKDTLFKALDTKKGIEFLDIIFKNAPANIIPALINTDIDLESFLSLYGFSFSSRLSYQWDIEKNIKPDRKIKKSRKKIGLKGRIDNHYTEAEIKLAEIMGDIFGMEEIDINLNFFDLGGDSMTAISIYHQLPDLFTLKSPVKIEEFLADTTVKGMAKLVETKI